MTADIHFYFDPVCPFAWMTSKWVRLVQAQREYKVDWRFISLRLLNSHVDYDAHFPPEYEAGHTAGLRLLRLAARTRAEHGRAAVAPLYAALGASDLRPGAGSGRGRGSTPAAEPRSSCGRCWSRPGCPASLADALDDDPGTPSCGPRPTRPSRLTGKDVGTPILQFEPPAGVAFFGPVISRLPDRNRPRSCGTT